jgi:RND family efflux transporter MFP subunit
MFVRKGAALILLKNPQITLAALRADNAYDQADAAVQLAAAQLLEGELRYEAMLLTLEKTALEIGEQWKVFNEQMRKFTMEEQLYLAGGVNEETIRSAKFELETKKTQIKLAEKELEIQRIGFGESDAAAGGLVIRNNFNDKEDEDDYNYKKRQAIIKRRTETLRAELLSAQARLSAAFQERESAIIAEAELLVKSPAEGIVAGRYFEEGERVKREDKILTVMDAESLYAVFPVRESEAFSIEKGMAASVTLDGTNKTYLGAVDLVSPTADSQSFTFNVRVLLPRSVLSDTMAKPGMFARVCVTTGPARNAVAVSDDAITNKKNNEGLVFVVRNKSVHERKIVFGESIGEDREIISGLSIGEIAVIRPDTGLTEGENVQVTN